MFLTKLSISLALIIVLISASKICAHKDDFLDETMVYLTLEKQEMELEFWLDYGVDEYKNNFIRNNFSSEFGITNSLMVDGRITYDSPKIHGFYFQSGRVETRYRFYDEGTLPLDFAVSAEVNVQRESNWENEFDFESRLIISKDIEKKINLTLNISEEFPLEKKNPSFLQSFGVRYDISNLFRFGSELKYNTSEGKGSVIPQIWFTFDNDITIKFGYSEGLNNNKINYGRIAFEAEI